MMPRPSKVDRVLEDAPQYVETASNMNIYGLVALLFLGTLAALVVVYVKKAFTKGKGGNGNEDLALQIKVLQEKVESMETELKVIHTRIDKKDDKIEEIYRIVVNNGRDIGYLRGKMDGDGAFKQS